MWHHVASRGLLRLRFIYRRLCLSFCGSCLVFLHCHCMLLWSCDRCSYRSRQAMQLKKPKLRCLRSFLEPDPFPAPFDLFVSLGDFLPLLLPLPAAFGPVLIFVFRRLLACILSCAKPITYSPLLIISIVCPMADLWSTAPVALADAPRYVGFRPRLLCLTLPDLPSPCQNSKTSLRMSEDSEVPEVVPECGIKLIYEKTKRPLKRARSLLRFHPEATVLQILRVQDVSGIVASSFEFFDFFNFSFNWFHLLNAFSTIHFGVLGWSHEELLDFWFPRLLCPTSCFSIGFGFLRFVLGH